MAKIPLYEPSVQLTHLGPGVEQDKNSFGLEQLAAAKTWEGVGQVGDKLSEKAITLIGHLKNYQDMNDLDNARISIDQKLLENSQAAKNLENPDDWVTAFRDSMGTAKEAVMEGLNRTVALHLNHHIASVMPSYEKDLMSAGWKSKISSFKGNIPQSMDNAIQTVVDAPDEFVAANAEANFKALVRTAGRSDVGGPAYLMPKEAAEWEAKFDIGLKTAKVNKAMLRDAPGTFAALQQPGAFGLNDTERAAVIPGVMAQVHRVQNDNYSRYMQNILGATADNPVQGAVMPTEDEILPQIGKTLRVPEAQNILAYIRGQKAGSGTGREYKTDPQSYKEAVTRLTDPDNPLTREEFLKNVESGEWKFDAKTYGGFLSNIGARGTKLDKAADSILRSRVGFWKTQFGLDPKGDQIMTALGQVQAAKDAGELGKTSEEISKTVDAIFKTQHDLYMQEWSLGTKKPAQAKPGIISRIGGLFGGQSGAAGPETISKDGKTYRILTIKGKKMVDPNPLP